MYDDLDVPVVAEAFVAGSSELIDLLVGPDCNKFTAYISKDPMPNLSVVLDNIDHLVDEPIKGYYEMRSTGHRNWFCGHLLDYFEGYPDTIYVSIKK